MPEAKAGACLEHALRFGSALNLSPKSDPKPVSTAQSTAMLRK